ncbi:hypothetical protein PLICRDRAFT_39132 [Plicaturopsis crispa FD-325 SS-3]|nr:hypothetical protein PLICRDRAFT_39132 [Plicaturopsis crispa FD-325 SS-3]
MSITLNLNNLDAILCDSTIDTSSPVGTSGFTMRRVQVDDSNTTPDPSATDHYTMHDVRLLHRGATSTIYRAVASTQGADNDTEAVLKTVRHRDETDADAASLIREYQWYQNQLRSLQGTVIPRCYGVFRGEYHGLWITSLVLQYCGQPRESPFNLTEKAYNVQTIDNLLEIHDCGVCHRDFSERHILDNDGQPFVVDFRHAELHDCGRDLIIVGDWRPTADDFGCDEVRDAAWNMRLWRELQTRPNDSTAWNEETATVEDLADSFLPGDPVVARQVMAQRAYEFVRQVDEDLKRTGGEF